MFITSHPYFRTSPEDSARLLTGIHPERRDWGYVEHPRFSAFGYPEWGHYKLVIYPPGTSATERRLLALWRRWIRWGAVAVFVIPTIGTSVIPHSGAFWYAIAAICYVSGLHVLTNSTRSLRARIRKLRVGIARVAGELRYVGDAQIMESSVQSLDEIDYKCAVGEVTPVEFERVWAQVYYGLPVSPAISR
jgi:hypothetical protein